MLLGCYLNHLLLLQCDTMHGGARWAPLPGTSMARTAWARVADPPQSMGLSDMTNLWGYMSHRPSWQDSCQKWSSTGDPRGCGDTKSANSGVPWMS